MRVVGLVSSEQQAWFERTYAANYELILGYAMQRTETRDDALDVVAVRLRTVAEPARTVRTAADAAPPGAITRAFGRLKDADREVLTLVGGEGLTPSEIAQVLACSTVAARVRLHRARARFAHELAAEGVQV